MDLLSYMIGRKSAGGGVEGAFAVISAFCDEDAEVCTCTQGQTVVSANVVDRWAYLAVPNDGTWVVESNGNTASVSITKRGQVESVKVVTMPDIVSPSWSCGLAPFGCL